MYLLNDMEVRFREFDQFNCWIWLRFSDIPSDGEKAYVDGIFDSWYVLGKLGGFNGDNLQLHNGGSDLSEMTYENIDAKSTMPALMHNMGQLEYKDNWARIWIDLGTSDSLALDVLINTFAQLDEDVVVIKELVIGGVNDDWHVDVHPDSVFPL